MLRSITEFEGIEVGPDFCGRLPIREHHIYRKTCNFCQKVLVELHYNCCGYSACGFRESEFMPLHNCREL